MLTYVSRTPLVRYLEMAAAFLIISDDMRFKYQLINLYLTANAFRL